MVKQVIKEFELRVFEESYQRIQKCLNSLDQEELWESPNENIPCVGCLTKHLVGNMKQWVLRGVLEGAFVRERDQEFVPEPEMTRDQLLQSLENARQDIQSHWKKLSNDRLSQPLIIQGFNTTGFSAMIHVIEHFSYHTGQISLLTKLSKNRDLGYYDDCDLDQ